MDQRKIGFFIADCRREQGLTQAQLAEKLGVTDKAVSKWETGRCLPDVSLFVPLTSILGTTIDEFLEGQRSQPVAGPEEKVGRRLFKKACRFFWAYPLLFLLLLDMAAEWWLFSRCYHRGGLHYIWFALPLRLLFGAGGYFFHRFLPRESRNNKVAHLLLAGGMSSVFLLELYATTWTAPDSGEVLRNTLFTSIGCLFVAGVVLFVMRTTRYDLILMGHLLSVLSAIYVFLYDQAFFPAQVGKVYLILTNSLFVYGVSVFVLFVLGRYLKKNDTKE